MSKVQIIRLEPHDDVVSVRDRLRWADTRSVILVWPKQDGILRRKLDLVLIGREAERMGIRLALITRDREVLNNASDLDIPAFTGLKEAKRHGWRFRTPRRRRPPPPLTREKLQATPQPKPVVALPPEFLAVRQAINWALFIGVVIILLAGAYVVVPGATVYLSPAVDPVTVTTQVTADPEAGYIDLDSGVIPARIVGIELEWSTTMPTTGRADVPGAKATGTVIFFNRIAEPVEIPAGTVVRTSAATPVRFRTTETANLPAELNASVEVPIEALNEFAGPIGNVGARLINRVEGPLALQVGVINLEPTSGGSTVEVPAVTQEDLDRLYSVVLQQLQQRAYAEMSTPDWLGPTEFLVADSLRVVLVRDEVYSAQVGEPAENVGLNMRVVVQGVVADEQPARQVAFARLGNRVPPGYRIDQSTLSFERGQVIGVDAERRVTFLMSCSGAVVAEIDAEYVRQSIAGVPVGRAREWMNSGLPLREPARIDLLLPWLGRMPIIPIRIDVQIVPLG